MNNSILYKKRIGVIAGSWTAEREETLILGEHLKKVLSQNGIVADLRIVGEDRNLFNCLKDFNVDFAFLETTEEIPIQPFLDSMGIAYSGSDNLETALSMNKEYIKDILKCRKIIVPNGICISQKQFRNGECVVSNFPVVIKPVSCGSSCGVSVVTNKKQLLSAIKEAFKHGDKIIIEDYIKGREITIPILNDEVMPAVEIKSSSGFWTAEEKCNLKVDFEVIPLHEKEIYQKIKLLIKKILEIFNFKSFWRVDTIYRNGVFYVLEINTLPCMAGGEKGIIPCSLKELGWTHFKFLSKIAEAAINNQIKFSRKLLNNSPNSSSL